MISKYFSCVPINNKNSSFTTSELSNFFLSNILYVEKLLLFLKLFSNSYANAFVGTIYTITLGFLIYMYSLTINVFPKEVGADNIHLSFFIKNLTSVKCW